MRWPVLLIGVLLVLSLVGARLADPEPVRTLRYTYFDYLQRLSPRDWQDVPVRVVDIDEASLAAIGQWPWPRSTVADLVDKLQGYGAAVVTFDVLFAEADRFSPERLLRDPAIGSVLKLPDDPEALARLDTDGQFAEAMRRMPTVLGVAAVADAQGQGVAYDKAGFVALGNDPAGQVTRMRRTTPLVPALEEAAAGIGSIDLSPIDATGVVRRVPLVWQSPSGPLPSLAVETLRVGIGESTYLLRGVADQDRAMESLTLGGYTIPTNSVGEVWMHFRRDDPRLYVSARDVLADRFDPVLQARLEGHLVLVGTSAAGLLDIRTTALGERVPGVSIHAQLLEQILTEDYLIRSDLIEAVEVLAFLVLGLVLILVMARYGPVVSIVTGGIGAAAILSASILAFIQRGALFDASYPMLAGLLTFGLMTAYQFIVADREKRMIRRSFSQYLAPSVLAEIERKGYRIRLGGEERGMTVMFSDIRNFTPLSEKLSPTELVSLLNDLFSSLTARILDRDGTIDKYIGDSIMAFWNAPLEIENHEAAAARAALDMRVALRAFFHDRPHIKTPVELAIGMASGTALVGNIGSRQRFNYSVLGDTVNVAARVEASCRPIGYDIVATGALRDKAADMAWLYAGTLELKGKSARMPLYLLLGDADMAASAGYRTLREAHDELVAAIETGGETRDKLGRCREMAVALDPTLTEFYSRIPDRYADFRQSETQSAARPR